MGSKYIGKILDSNNFGKFKILQEMEIIGNKIGKQKRKRFEIEFLDTGYKTIVPMETVMRHCPKDKLKPTVSGIGYLGSEINTYNKYAYLFL